MILSSVPISDLPISSSIHMENRSNGEVFDITLCVQPIINVLLTIDNQ